MPLFGSRNPFLSDQLSNLGRSGSRLRDAFSAVSGSGALWIFFAGDFQWGSARTGTDSNCPRRVLDDPQRRHGHPMGQKKIPSLGCDLAVGPLRVHWHQKSVSPNALTPTPVGTRHLNPPGTFLRMAGAIGIHRLQIDSGPTAPYKHFAHTCKVGGVHRCTGISARALPPSDRGQ